MTEFRTINQVAELLGVHPKTVRSWVDSGKLKAIRVGKLFRIPEQALAEFTEGMAKPQVAQNPQREEASALLRKALDLLEQQQEQAV